MKKNIFAIILSMILIFSLPITMAVKAYELPAYVSNSYENYNQSTADYNLSQVRRSRSRSHSHYRSHSASSNSIDLAIYCIAGLIVLVFTFITFKINKKKSTKVYKNIPPIFPHNANMQIAKYIYKKDENFNLEKFLNWVKNIFLTLENAFSQRDWQKIFTFESKELFEEHNAQIQELISLGRVNIKDNINIIDAYLHKLVIDGNSENLTVSIRATMNNYIVDEASGSIITGKKEEVFDTIYQMTFVRTNGIKTTIINGESITKIEKSDWTLTKFEPVDNNFVDDISGIVFNNNNKF
ncbi:TIM44-like domain-containing protein [Pseudoruminococcus massiliensis]|uniref:TIM44-like domain-containing protein n=1 Tax=Pseudoruminococcus massiliensis TaxID=2086583 RepID=UPI0022E7194B|nr:TIM44-like domain-containing protein [Pseudoruminococcus massiliensis]